MTIDEHDQHHRRVASCSSGKILQARAVHFTKVTTPRPSVMLSRSQEGTPGGQKNEDVTQATQQKPPRASRLALKKALQVFSGHREDSMNQFDQQDPNVPERGRLRNRFDFDLQFGPDTGGSVLRHMPKSASSSALPVPQTKFLAGNLNHDNHVNGKSQSKSPIKAGSGITDKKDKRRPKPLNLTEAIKHGQMAAQRKGWEAIHEPIIESARVERRKVNDDGSSSIYPGTGMMDRTPVTAGPSVSPLQIIKRSEVDRINRILKAEKATPREQDDDAVTLWPGPNSLAPALPTLPSSVYDGSNDIAKSPEEQEVVTMFGTGSPGHSSAPLTRGFVKSATTNDILPSAGMAMTPFTPLSAWMVDLDGYTRKVSKNLFGDHGWLQDTAAAERKPEPPKAAGFLTGFKTFARGIAEKASYGHATGGRCKASQRTYVSLEPREQSLLYREIEFVLSNALDSYINAQLHGGRLDPGKLKKISDAWRHKGRPRVVGFRYDLETQLGLVILHMRQFRFYGPLGRPAHIDPMDPDAHEDERVAVRGLLGAMTTNARQMRVRTLCLPDPVIAKHILDSQALLQLLGVPDSMQLALAECSQFFKIVVERQRAKRVDEEHKAVQEREKQQSILMESSIGALVMPDIE